MGAGIRIAEIQERVMMSQNSERPKLVNLESEKTKRESVRALTTAESYALAIAQGYHARAAAERRPGRKAEGLGDPVDLVVLA